MQVPSEIRGSALRMRDRVAIVASCLIVTALIAAAASLLLRSAEPVQKRKATLAEVSTMEEITSLPSDARAVYARDLEDRGLAELSKRGSLSNLSVNWSPRLRDLTWLGTSNIKVLALSRVPNVDWGSLGAMPLLEELAIGVGSEFGDDDARTIVLRCPRLRRLEVYDNGFLTGAGLTYLAELFHLETIELINCYRITVTGLTAFAKSPTLRDMTVEGAQINDATISALALLIGLESLDLRGCVGLSNEALSRLARQLPRTSVTQRS